MTGYATLAVSYWNAQLQPIGTTSGGRIGGTTDWTTITGGGPVPPGTTYIRVEYRLFGPGRLWIGPAMGVLLVPRTIPNVRPPAVIGPAQVGRYLAADIGAWGPGGLLVYQDQSGIVFEPAAVVQVEWLRCDPAGAGCRLIPDAGGTFIGSLGYSDDLGYTVRESDVGSTLRIRVTVTDTPDGRGSATSAPTAVVVSTAGELAPDPGLEVDPAPFYRGYGPGSFSWATDAAHGGTHSLKIVSTTGVQARWLSRPQTIPVTPGASYDVAA